MKNGTLKKEQVKKNIVFRILSGEYPLAGKLPTERELCDIMDVSRITIRAAIDDLVQDGVLEKDSRRATLIKQIPAKDAVYNKKQQRILFIYFSSIKGQLIDQTGASARLYRGIEHFANEHNCGLMVQSGENFISQSQKQRDSVDGIIVGGAQLEKHLPNLLSIGVPVVAADALPYSKPIIDAVYSDNYEAGIRAGEKVLERKYKKPLLVIVRYENEDFIQPSFQNRRRGFFDFAGNNEIEEIQHIVDYKDLFNNGKSVKELCSVIKEKSIDSIIDCSDLARSHLSGFSELSSLPTIIVGGVEKNHGNEEKFDLISFDTERVGYLAAERLHQRFQNPCLKAIRYLVPAETKMEQ